MAAQSFGGAWTQEKLEILGRYLDAYTTALKEQPFQLIYIDAFAGSGYYQTEVPDLADDYADFQELHKGSAKIAIEIDNKPFDRLIYIEKDPVNYRALTELRNEHPERQIDVRNSDANLELPIICRNLGNLERAVVFLDPFATEVEWATVQAVAETKKIDCWILFPIMAVGRMMPTGNEPPESWKQRLDSIFGGRENWERAVYHPQSQLGFFDEPGIERDPGIRAISRAYRTRLEASFTRVAPNSKILSNSKNSAIFELFFAAGNLRGAPIAIDIAKYILDNW